ncbi:DUF930 domain-containing protein [Salmonella enterica subsp. enterica]|nr:hypothetical protein [Salmonella enterica subsp. salamae]ECF6040777.1 DUF930 domain-containing protein [Salmonella enterica subsp. salamae]EDB2515918.1 DUF930 domain-containing protein [Salmonella enterica]EEC4477558.1 DUF930 domain-containing protein [Salmonella enterica]EEG3130720.1 DUF930 domain-containing protein [Salmonella enterica subsp. enterica serovar Nima]
MFEKKKLLILLCTTGLWHAGPVSATEAVLNQAQRNYLNSLIERQVSHSSDREIIKTWSEARKAGEFICRPLAKKIISEKYPLMDKVILSQGVEGNVYLKSSTLLVGEGAFRTGNQWMNFSFQCEFSGTTGKPLKFDFRSW